MDKQSARATWVRSSEISVLVTAASLWGLLSQDAYVQETSNWATQARSQDIGNLTGVGFPPRLPGDRQALTENLTTRWGNQTGGRARSSRVTLFHWMEPA